jgi:hypothetical protein
MDNPDKKPWFGPHRLGWGYGPTSWQGWVITLAILLAVIVAVNLLKRH